MESNSISECGFLRLDARKKAPLFRQLYDQLRAAILQGVLRSDDRIPSSRDLMQQLGVSRTTVVTALDMLISEGYLATSHGKGTFVASEVPDQKMLLESNTRNGKPGDSMQPIALSRYGRSVEAADRRTWYSGRPSPLCPGEPALDLFPARVWSKIVRRIWKTMTPLELSYGEPAGYFPLRTQVAEYLRAHRGVVCEPSQVMIVNGTQQAIDIIARLTLDRGDKVLVENPGYLSARETYESQGSKIVPIPVDEQGATIKAVPRTARQAKLIYVTPSHQFPFGVTMSIERRLELVHWAKRNGALILEDDYDSEYRYGQKPLPCLQGLDNNAQTIYVGSFSKVVCPGFGVGYAILPEALVPAFENVLRLVSRPPSQVDQIVLSEFIREGHFVRHIRRMRKAHGERRQILVDHLQEQLSHRLAVIGSSAGLHCTAILKGGRVRDTAVVQRLAQRRLVARALSNYYTPETKTADRRNGLVLGFASSTPDQIRTAVNILKTELGS